MHRDQAGVVAMVADKLDPPTRRKRRQRRTPDAAVRAELEALSRTSGRHATGP
jgi:hypothetical protein